MKEKKKRLSMSYRRYCAMTISVMLVGLLLAALRTAAVLSDYEADIQYFKLGSVFAFTFNAGAVVLVVLAFILPLFVSKEKFIRTLPVPGPREYVLCFLSAALLAAYAIFEAKDFFSRGDAETAALSGQTFTSRFHFTSGLCVLLSLGLIVYLVLTALDKPGDKRVRAVVGCAGVAFLIFRLLALYFDTSSPINSPIKTLDQMANSAALLYLAGELRMTVSDARPRFALQTGVAAFVLLFPSAVSQLVGSFSGVLPLGNAKVLYALFELFFSLYVGARVLTILLNRKPAPAPLPAEEDGERA